MYLVQASLLGTNCRYNQRNNYDQPVVDLARRYRMFPVVPEMLGGMGRPFPPTEIVGGTGVDVLEYRARVKDKDGNDYTRQFLFGSEETYYLYCLLEAKAVIFHDKSTSCGVHRIHNGQFSGTLIAGEGVTTAYLRQRGVPVYCQWHLPSMETLELDHAQRNPLCQPRS